MDNTIIYHNPRCRKSRETLQLLEDNGIKPEVRLYLESPPSEKEVKELSKMLGMEPIEFTRKQEKIYKELRPEERDLPSAMSKNPILIERPIVIHKGRAAIGRPPERAMQLFV